MKKRALISDNGSELGFHIAYQLVERNYDVILITDVPMDNPKILSFHVNWYDVWYDNFKNFTINSKLFEDNKNPFDIIYFSHILPGGPSETSFLPYVGNDEIDSWQHANYSNVISTYQLVKELSNYIKHDTKVIWKLNGVFDFKWPEGFKYGTSAIFEASRISLLKSFSLYMHGIYSGINISDSDASVENSASEIINTIENITKENNGNIIKKDGTILID